MPLTNETKPTRRAFLKNVQTGVVAAAALSMAPNGAKPTSAHTLSRTPATLNGAGFYRFALGTKILTVLADGSDVFPGQSVFAVNASKDEFSEVQERLLLSKDAVDFSMNTLLVEENGRKILIDAGFGHFLGARFGRQTLALQNAGIDPSEIDTVIITHGHADHFAGLVAPDLAPRFPNAQIIWNEKEWNYWTSDRAFDDVLNSPLPDGFKNLFISTTQTVLPLAAANVERVNVQNEQEIAPGIVLLPASGHSPHSIVVLISSGSEQLLYASDTTLLVKQNTIAPSWVSAFEYDGPTLVDTRMKLLDRAAADKIVWFGYHADFPSLGRIRKAGGNFEFIEEPWRWP